MARYSRRLIFWFLGGLASLAALALLAVAALFWLVDPDDYRGRIEARASAAIGRPVHLTGKLRWQLGRQIFIVSEGGDIANSPGFGSQPLVRWSRIRLGVAARPLFSKLVIIDRIAMDGMQLQLQRNAQGEANWELPFSGAGESEKQSVAIQVAVIELRDASIHYQDAASGADWRAKGIAAGVKLPDDLGASDRMFRDVNVSGLINGGELPAQGVAMSVRASELRQTPQQLQVPQFDARVDNVALGGAVTVQYGATRGVNASLTLKTPSLRALMATAGLQPPLMRDPLTLGGLQAEMTLRYAKEAVSIDSLSMSLDDTRLTGTASLPSLEPLVLRFNLSGDHIDLDRYREPEDVKGEPFELPLAKLKALDAKGSLRIEQATVAGAAAREIRIDVE